MPVHLTACQTASVVVEAELLVGLGCLSVCPSLLAHNSLLTGGLSR